MTNLISAVIAVMNDVKNIEKNLQVGTGSASYKGIADKDVKHIVGNAMAKHGLVILPIKIEETCRQDRWVEDAFDYNTKTMMPKTKQSVFVEVKVTYDLCHTSGESMQIMGYGHGVDSQDKAAGKATTYALKYALLYTFLIPTGTIEDSDNHHSETIQTADLFLQVKDKVNAIENETDLNNYFKANMAAFNKNKAIIELFTNRKTEIKNESVNK